ncbi:hypothetical protein TNCV_1627161 [Trichonephila clavipes]|nr:hypothetical protein TNCV_1627161 [Trichonephila clavipes]
MYQLRKAPTETSSMLVRVYEDQLLSMKCVYEWFTRFREGWKNVCDKSRSERPAISDRVENIETVSKLITKDPRLIMRVIGGP